MDSFEFNKITASVLIALLVAMTGSLLSDYLVHPTKLEKPAFVIEGIEVASKPGEKPAEEESLKPITPLLASANAERGQAIAKKCTQCHTFDKGGANRTGPNLWGIIGAKVAHAADFAYSSGFKDKGGNWDNEKLNILLHKTPCFCASNKNVFRGTERCPGTRGRHCLPAYFKRFSHPSTNVVTVSAKIKGNTMKKLFWILCVLWTATQATLAETPAPKPAASATHGFSAFGELKYPEDFTHFEYTNPDAPKGGSLRLGSMGTFDSLNLYIVKGMPPGLMALTTATLLEEAYDRPGESYGYAAESVEVAPDNSSVIFRLNPKAKFNNGDPVTADDVIWVFETLRTKGAPMYRTYYKNITKVEKLDGQTIKFTFNTTTNRELPMILGQLPILSKKFYETQPFDETTLKPGPFSGPYEVEAASPGHSFVIKRVKNWWGKELPSQKGRHNFDQIRCDYYLEGNALFEGFKSGQFDVRQGKYSQELVHSLHISGFPKRLC